MKKRRFLFVFLAVAALAAGVFAKSGQENPHWFTAGEIQALVLQEPPPPATDSAEDKADLQADLLAQTGRLAERIAEARTDSHYSVTLFTKAIGPKITPGNDPATFRLFARLNNQARQVVGEAKNHWHRLRPYQAHREIHQLFDVEGFSYPSGHAAHSFAFAVILGGLFPERAEAFLQRARQISQSRVDAGVHYPSDIREGEALGRKIARELLAKPAFIGELNAAKAELARGK